MQFPATNGYNVIITDLLINQQFSGQDLKDGKLKIQNKMHYEVNFNANSSTNSVTFHYIGHSNHKGNGVSAGELGLWCSVLRILHDVKSNEYNNILIFEDDAAPAQNTKHELANLINHLPQDYDLVYLDYTLYNSNTKVVLNDYVHSLTNQASGHGTHAYMLSANAINTMINLIENNSTYAIDNFYWCITTGNTRLQNHPIAECNAFANSINIHAASHHFIDLIIIEDAMSIEAMGR